VLNTLEMISTILKAVKICFNRISGNENKTIYLNKKKKQYYHAGACNMNPGDVAKMIPHETIIRSQNKNDRHQRKPKNNFIPKIR